MRVSPSFASFCIWLAASAGAEDDHGHGHGSAAYEWAGIFEVPENNYMWTAQKVSGSYADPAMKLAILPAPNATKEALDALAQEGAHALGETCVDVNSGGALIPQMDACYRLVFDEHLWQSLYTVNTTGVGSVAFFAEHVPTEFESTAHYLKDKVGEDIEPVAELPEEEETGMTAEQWGGSLGSAAIVNVVTLVGVVLTVPAISKAAAANAAIFDGLLSAFSAGTLLSCAFFLLLFESTHLIGEGWTGEVDVLWRWGTMVLAGFVLPAVIDVSVHASSGEGAKTDENAITEATGEPRSKARLIGAVLLGDFMHNLCDGFFLGAAFKGCGTGFGWGVALGTILHELPQELADYAILTGKSVGLSPKIALLCNFLSGLSVMLGCLIINLADVSNSAVGLLLAFGGGVYVYIAAVECMPRVHRLQLSPKNNGLCLLAFVVGTVIIGLILLDHEHCAPGGHAHGHGHGH